MLSWYSKGRVGLRPYGIMHHVDLRSGMAGQDIAIRYGIAQSSTHHHRTISYDPMCCSRQQYVAFRATFVCCMSLMIVLILQGPTLPYMLLCCMVMCCIYDISYSYCISTISCYIVLRMWYYIISYHLIFYIMAPCVSIMCYVLKCIAYDIARQSMISCYTTHAIPHCTMP